jgi:hypothetical protein
MIVIDKHELDKAGNIISPDEPRATFFVLGSLSIVESLFRTEIIY